MKKIPLRVYFAAVMGLLLLIVTVLLARRLIVNHDFVSAYGKGDYKTEQENSLLTMNFPESFVPYYNLGNAAYRYGDYNAAISYYTKALENYPPEGKDCKIRINLALALCDTIDFYHLDTQEKVDTALFVLYKARDVLLEKGCASNEGDGHDADAQQLKEDIDKMIEKLENPDKQQPQQQQQDSSGNDDNSSSGNDSKPSEKEKRAQGELEGKKKDAMEDRKDQQGDLEKWSDYIGGDGQEEDGAGEGGTMDNTSPW